MKSVEIAGVHVSRRSIYLDIENIAGTPIPRAPQARTAFNAFIGACDHQEYGRMTVACNHLAAPTVALELGLSGSQLQRGSGVDGADRALLAVIRDDLLSRRVDEIVIGSGDGIFARELTDLRHLIVKLEIVAVEGTLSRALQKLADDVILLEPNIQFAA
jgi:NYN domain